MAHAFDITALNNKHIRFEGGVTRTHFGVWTSAGLSESSAISAAFGVDREGKIPKQELVEKTLVETVYGGYNNQNRMCFPGEHVIGRSKARNGVFENKSKLVTRDFALPAAPYDLRVTLSTEQDLKSLGEERYDNPIPGWTSRRLKRRRSYTRSGFVWQLDVTEVTTSSSFQDGKSVVEFEIEVELNAESTLKLINETDEEQCRKTCKEYAGQLWWMISNINPLSDVLDVEDFLENHPNKNATNLAVGQCGALKKFMDSRRDGGQGNWAPAIGPSKVSSTPSQSLKFPGCMPVNFSRHHIEEVQRSDSSGGYYLSEKTDGVRYFMVFTGETVVLVDRTMTGKRVKPRDGKSEPMSHLLPLIKPGTVFDGEVVMNRKYRRPIFIVFDVLTISDTQPILQLPFQERLKHLMKASFRTNNADKDMFDKRLITDKSLNISLPLARKNFVSRMELDEKLLSHVSVDKGLRSYKNGDHYHLTDGIIFQPNLPYSCGTDVNLLKWKYLDTVTIDVQIVPPKFNDDEDVLRVEVSGEDGSFVDMTRFINLPNSERRRLEADREETKAKIVEVGFEPTTGEWYYLTMVRTHTHFSLLSTK
jgi:mRNA guanylyltransferase